MPFPSLGPIERFMMEDHARVDQLLAVATAGAEIDPFAYARFRHDLLRHIAMEEKVLLPYARNKRLGSPLAIASQLRADHGMIAKLLVRSPTRDTIDELLAILGRHNRLEEGPGGLYSRCDALAGLEADAVVERLKAQPKVPLAAYYDGPLRRRA